MTVEMLKKISDVDTNVGYLALLSKDAQTKWTKYQTGELKAITFDGRDPLEMAELCSEQGYDFNVKNGEFYLELSDQRKAEEIINFIESQKPSVWVAVHCLYDNSYDRMLENSSDHFVHIVNEGKPEKAYVADFGKGLYDIYETKKGIECWKDYTPFQEHELYGTHVLDTIVLEEETEFFFQDPSTLHEEEEQGFILPKGTYAVEIGFDGDGENQVLRVIRKDAPFTTNASGALIRGIQELLTQSGIDLSDDLCEEVITYIKNHNV